MRFCLLFLVLALAVAPCKGQQAPGSLYDPAHAKKIAPGMEILFGPKSVGNRYDQRMIRAAEIALKRAHKKTTWHCWGYVKDAMLASQAISRRPTTPWAKQAGEELCQSYGFIKIKETNPYRAPVGAVIVYGGADAGHVELRAANGFVSDFISPSPYPRPLVGIYVKPVRG